jgi:hypothetical protein
VYSRPQTDTVSALEKIPTAAEIEIIGSSKTKISENGRVIDKRDPAQLYRNGVARASEVTNFIEGLTKVADKIVPDLLTKQAYNQVGELLKTQDPVQLIRSGNEEQRALVRSLSPQAQDILNDTAAQGAVRLYQDTFAAEQTKRLSILQSPTASQEDKVRALNDAKSTALEASGIGAMRPENLVKYAGTLSQIDATLQGINYKETLKTQDANDKTIWRNGLKSTLLQMTEDRTTLAIQGEDALKAYILGDGTAERPGLKKHFEAEIQRTSARYTPLEQAELWNTTIREETARLRGLGLYDQAEDYLRTVVSLDALGVNTPAGVPFMQQTLSNGYSLKYTVDALRKELEGEAKAYRRQQAIETSREAIGAALRGDETARAQFQNSLSQLRTADEMLAAASAFNQADSIGSQPTNEQMRRAAELRFEIGQEGADPKKMWERVKAAGLTPEQTYALAGSIQQGSSGSVRLVAGAKGYLNDEIIAAGSQIAQSLGTTDEATVSTLTRDLNNAASRATEQRITALQQQGQQVNPDQARDIFRNELEAIRNTRIKEARAASSPYQDTNDRRVAAELQQFGESVKASNGEVTVMSFPGQVRTGFQKRFPGRQMTVPALEKYMLERMEGVKNGDGKPVYADPSKTLQQIIKKEKDRADPVGAQIRNGVPTGYEYAIPIMQTINGWFGPKPQAAPSTGASPVKPQEKPAANGPQSRAQPQRPNPAVAMVTNGLSAVANVFTPPAAAATRTAMEGQGRTQQVQNASPEAVQMLSKLWAKREPLRADTPPLPQVAAQTPVQMVGTAINNVMHPIFVAIGIAEGTRTASGGYTSAYYGHRDPGSGAWNKGTIAGQNAPNAQLADRQWMARLTSTSTRLAPVLQRLGVAPGTQGYNRLLFNVLDLTVQAPLAAQDFINKIPQVVRQGASIEAIAKARADSFINPATGRLEAGGFGNSYSRLLADQRSRAGAFDYKRRI